MNRLVFILIVMAIAVMHYLVSARAKKMRLARYWSRPCMGRQWRRRFPLASKEEIRTFLDLLLEAFMFKEEHRLKFGPDDTLMGIYQTVYAKSSCDAMELEEFMIDLDHEYGLDLSTADNFEDITLGEVFSMTRKRGSFSIN